MPVIWPRQSARRLMGVYNVREEPYGARPSESAATNLAAIQRAIDAANTAGGGTVLLPEIGTYQTNTHLTLYSNVCLRGTGAGTVLALVTTTTDTYTIKADGTLSSGRALASNGSIGDGSVTLVSGSVAALSLAAGDLVMIQKENGSSDDWRYQVTRVRSISGQTISLYDPLYENFATADSSSLKKVTPVSNVTISDLTIDGDDATGTNGHGISITKSLNARFERVTVQGYNGYGLLAQCGYGTTARDVKLFDSGTSGHADFTYSQQGNWTIDNVVSEFASGFGPQVGWSNGGSSVNLRSYGATQRAIKFASASFNTLTNTHAVGGYSTGFGLTIGCHDNVCHGVLAMNNGAGGADGTGVWLDAYSVDNQLYGVDSRFNTDWQLVFSANSARNLVSGRVEPLSQINHSGSNNTLRTPTFGQCITAVGSTSGPTTTSASYADLEEMDVTLTTTGGDLIVDAECVVSHSSLGETVTLALSLDGAAEVAARTVEAHTANSPQSVSLHHKFSDNTATAAGTRRVKVRWLTSASTATAVTTQRSLRVFEGAHLDT